MARSALSMPELAGVVQKAGWPRGAQAHAVATAEAESSGQYWVVNSSGHMGLFQIAAEHHFPGDMLDPVQNAQAALKLYNADKQAGGNGWRPWAASNARAALLMPRARRAVGNPAAPLPSSPGSGGATAAGFFDFAWDVSPIHTFITLVTDPGKLLQAGYVLLGGILLLWSVYSMMGRSIVKDATTVAKVAVAVPK